MFVCFCSVGHVSHPLLCWGGVGVLVSTSLVFLDGFLLCVFFFLNLLLLSVPQSCVTDFCADFLVFFAVSTY